MLIAGCPAWRSTNIKNKQISAMLKTSTCQFFSAVSPSLFLASLLLSEDRSRQTKLSFNFTSSGLCGCVICCQADSLIMKYWSCQHSKIVLKTWCFAQGVYTKTMMQRHCNLYMLDQLSSLNTGSWCGNNLVMFMSYCKVYCQSSRHISPAGLLTGTSVISVKWEMVTFPSTVMDESVSKLQCEAEV